MNKTALTLAMLVLAAPAFAASPQLTTPQEQPQAYTFAVDLDASGRLVDVEPTAAMPADMRAALESQIRQWAFTPAARDGHAAGRTRTYVRIAVASPRLRNGMPAILAATTGPALASFQNPVYPTSELRRGEGGVVVLQLEVDASGQVTHAGFHGDRQRASRSLANAALSAAGEWRFLPEQVDGQPVASTVVMPVCFMADHPTPSSCEWQGPDARSLNRMAIVTLDPAAEVDTRITQIAGF